VLGVTCHVVLRMQAEISRICNRHYSGFIGCAEELLKMRADLADLSTQVHYWMCGCAIFAWLLTKGFRCIISRVCLSQQRFNARVS
jgi:hypothetical protein